MGFLLRVFIRPLDILWSSCASHAGLLRYLEFTEPGGDLQSHQSGAVIVGRGGGGPPGAGEGLEVFTRFGAVVDVARNEARMVQARRAEAHVWVSTFGSGRSQAVDQNDQGQSDHEAQDSQQAIRAG